MRSRRPGLWLLPLSLLALWGCGSDGTGPGELPEGELTILRLAANAPPFESSTVSFFAKKGENREGRIFFLDEDGKRGEEFARLKVDGPSLLTRPDGTPFVTGDSILITMRVVNPAQVLIELEPAGLLFSPLKPAELRLDYEFADEDFDEDGDVDDRDRDLEPTFAIWRQLVPGAVFVRLGSVKIEDLREIEAKLNGFSRYAIAY